MNVGIFILSMGILVSVVYFTKRVLDLIEWKVKIKNTYEEWKIKEVEKDIFDEVNEFGIKRGDLHE